MVVLIGDESEILASAEFNRSLILYAWIMTNLFLLITVKSS